MPLRRVFTQATSVDPLPIVKSAVGRGMVVYGVHTASVRLVHGTDVYDVLLSHTVHAWHTVLLVELQDDDWNVDPTHDEQGMQTVSVTLVHID